MSAVLSRENHGTIRLVLSGELTIETAAQLHAELSRELDAETSLAIDARAVSFIDTSIVQILLIATHRVKAFRIENRSASWERTWGLLGLDLAPPEPGPSTAS